MNMGTCIIFYKSHWSHSHSNIQLVPSRIIFEKGWMRASIGSVWIALEARQEAVLAHPLKPGAAFSALACLALRAALISLGCEFGVLGLVWCASSLLLRLLRAFALLAASSLGSQLLYIQNPLRLSPHRWRLRAQGASLSSIGWVARLFSCQRTPSCLTQIWMQKILWQKKHDLLPSRRIIWFQCIEVLDVSDSKLRWSLVKIGIGQPCRSNKRAGINRRLFWPTRCARRARADGICNYSWFANGRFSQLQLPRFHNGL